jgi:hypothetical protein
MAGAPKRMAKKIETLECVALTLFTAISEVIPERYLETDPVYDPETGEPREPNWAFHRSGDPVGQAWQDVVRSAYLTMVRLALLGFAVRDRAGLPGLGVLCGILEGLSASDAAAENDVADGPGKAAATAPEADQSGIA